MKKIFGIILLIALGLSALLLTIAFQAGWVKANPFKQQERLSAPTIVSYQGAIYEGNTTYDGIGYFKFAIIDLEGSTTYWSNDATSIAGSQPANPVSLQVSHGQFSVNLGDRALPNMSEPLEAGVFNDPNTLLRVWFSPDNMTFTLLIPDQVIASVPYALQAQNAELAETALMANEAVHAEYSTFADRLDGHDGTDFQLLVTGTCPVGQAVRAINLDGTVICYVSPTHSLSTLGAGHELVDAMVDVAIGSDGLGVIAYLNATNGNLNVFHCDDLNCKSGTNQVVDFTDDVGYFPSITIGTDGFPLISYFDFTNDDLKVAHCNNVDCSSRTLSIPDPTGLVGYDTSITIGGDGFGLISYYNATNGNLKVAHCSNTACTSFTITALDLTGDVGQSTSITTGSTGFGIISYYDTTNDNLKLAFCGNAACEYTSNMGTVASSAGYGGTSVALGVDGFPLILHKDTVNFDLWVAWCGDTLCTAPIKFKLDTINDHGYGGSISLAIGVDGLGVMSYYDGVWGDLIVAHCDNPRCSSVTKYALDMQGNVGEYTSIAIGSDGLPLIAYTDENEVLKVAHCSNEMCIPINWEP